MEHTQKTGKSSAIDFVLENCKTYDRNFLD